MSLGELGEVLIPSKIINVRRRSRECSPGCWPSCPCPQTTSRSSQFSEIFHNFLFRRGRQGQRCPTPLAQSAWLSFPSRSRWGLGSCFESPEKCFAGDPPRLPWWHPSCLPPSLHLPVALRVIFALLHFFLIKNNIYIFFNFLNSQALHLPCLQKHIDLE